jgi:hypothetical protein
LHSLLDLEQKERGISIQWGEYGIRFPCSSGIQTAACRLRVDSRDTLEEMQAYIEESAHIPSGTDYMVLQYWEYFKHIPKS